MNLDGSFASRIASLIRSGLGDVAPPAGERGGSGGGAGFPVSLSSDNDGRNSLSILDQ